MTYTRKLFDAGDTIKLKDSCSGIPKGTQCTLLMEFCNLVAYAEDIQIDSYCSCEDNWILIKSSSKYKTCTHINKLR